MNFHIPQNELTGANLSNLFFRVNDIKKFRFSRPFYRKDPLKASNTEENEFASLWLERTVLEISYPLPGILRWFPVTAQNTFQVQYDPNLLCDAGSRPDDFIKQALFVAGVSTAERHRGDGDHKQVSA